MISIAPLRTGTACMAVFLLSCGLTSCSLADLRPDELRATESGNEAEGWRLIELALRGRPWIVTDRPLQMDLRDIWRSGLMRRFTPLTQNDESLRVRFAGKGKMAMEFLAGSRKGDSLVLEGKDLFEVVRGKRSPRDSSGDRIYLESFRLYLTLPALLRSKKRAVFAGTRTVGGKNYRLVFLTDGPTEPSKDADQYLVYINDADEIEWIAFTYRELLGSYSGALHYTDVRRTPFGFVPFSIAVADKVGDADFVHRFVLERIGPHGAGRE
jgi:hypothetical protein